MLRIGVFESQIKIGEPRGALRLFRSILMFLNDCEGIELLILHEFASSPEDVFGCDYKYSSFNEWLSSNNFNLWKSSPLDTSLHQIQTSEILKRKKGYISELLDGLNTKLTEICLSVFVVTMFVLGRVTKENLKLYFSGKFPIKDFPITTIYNINEMFFLSDQLKKLYEIYVIKSSSLSLSDSLFSESRERFTNKDIKNDFISLYQIDAVIDFWWFHHSVKENPLAQSYRPKNLKIYGWFLDAIPLRVPNFVGQISPVDYRLCIENHLSHLDEIFTISATAKNDIEVFFPKYNKKINIIPCGIFDEDFVDNKSASGFLNQFELNPDILTLCIIGSHEPAKNTINSVLAISSFAEEERVQVQLVILGGEQFKLTGLMEAYSGKISQNLRVVFLQKVTEFDKRSIYRISDILVYASLWEGFGIPPLEAMAAGCQVVVGDIPTVHEFYGDLAEICDPYDISSIKASIKKLVNQSTREKNEWKIQAKAHAKNYLWTRSANEMARILLSNHS